MNKFTIKENEKNRSFPEYTYYHSCIFYTLLYNDINKWNVSILDGGVVTFLYTYSS